MPRTEVTRNTAFSPSAMVTFWRMLAIVARASRIVRRHVGHPVAQDGRIGGFQRHIGARAHRHADRCLFQRRCIVDAVADHHHAALAHRSRGLGQLVFGHHVGAELPCRGFRRWPRPCEGCRRSGSPRSCPWPSAGARIGLASARGSSRMAIRPRGPRGTRQPRSCPPPRNAWPAAGQGRRAPTSIA
jgi:hypothetical protein